jgi:hypothetical protein
MKQKNGVRSFVDRGEMKNETKSLPEITDCCFVVFGGYVAYI